MITKKFPLEDVQEAFYGDYNLISVNQTKWEQDGKAQYQSIVFYEKDVPDVFWECGVTRTGSPFTDWYYEWGEDSNKMVECVQVHKVEKVITEWEQV